MIGTILRMLWVMWVTLICLHYCSFTHIPKADAQEFLADGGTWFYIPKPEVKKYPSHEYTVQAGDTLAGIASKHGMTWQQLWDINRDRVADPNIIHVGQKIRIRGSEIVVPPKPELTREQKVEKLVQFMVSKSGLPTEKIGGRTLLEGEINKCHDTLYEYGVSHLDDSRLIYNRLIILSRYYEFYLLAEAIIDQVQSEDEFYKLVGLAWQESHFLNVRGKKGEITFYQFLPSTLKWWYKTDDIGTVVVMDKLKNSPKEATALALDMLRKNKWNWNWWNRGIDYEHHLTNKIYWFKSEWNRR